MCGLLFLDDANARLAAGFLFDLRSAERVVLAVKSLSLALLALS
jgi:hypothetical protein